VSAIKPHCVKLGTELCLRLLLGQLVCRNLLGQSARESDRCIDHGLQRLDAIVDHTTMQGGGAKRNRGDHPQASQPKQQSHLGAKPEVAEEIHGLLFILAIIGHDRVPSIARID
jgi:hypothetical protein